MSNRKPAIEVQNIDRIVGAFIVGAMIIVLLSWFLNLHSENESEDKTVFKAIISQSFDLTVGGKIELAGIAIGAIDKITLQHDGQVLITLGFFNKYKKFLTVGSQLEIKSALGMQNIFGDKGLVFNYNPKEKVLLQANALLNVKEPVDLAAQIEAFDLPQLAVQVKSIVSNVEEITNHLKNDQGALFATLDNINKITANLSKSTDEIPLLLKDVQQQIPRILSSVEKNLNNLEAATGAVPDILTRVDALVINVGDSTKKLPSLLSRSTNLLDNSIEMTDKLNNHWILGGDKKMPKSWPSIHSIGESPYDLAD